MSERDTAGFNLGLLEKEIPGYTWYETLTNLSNWVSAGGLVLAMISLVLQWIQRCRITRRRDTTDMSAAVRVTITNTQEPGSQHVYT